MQFDIRSVAFRIADENVICEYPGQSKVVADGNSARVLADAE